MNKCRSIARIILFVVISIIIGLKLYSWNARTLIGNKMPMPFGYGFSVVLSGSMEPELKVNDLVIIKKQKSYQSDDIIVYQDDDLLVIHRLIEINGENAITKGDANEVNDPEISTAQIKGKMVMHIHFIGCIVQFIKSTIGTFLVLLGAVIMFELPYVREKRKTISEQERIKEEIRRLKNE
ncbi:signal peptidase I [uncultured Ruminococcus sp.]|uniref:signal peptidase I n=1 Tax=uncultured Ruminococcus sp. TaxID=165186 RepID=UPI0025CDA859|nr:signal peptidase I [uncultured Ruminococcus sp.]